MLAGPPPVTMVSTEAVVPAAEHDAGSNTVAAHHARNQPLLSPLSAEDGHTFQPPESGGHTFPPQIGDSLITGTHVMGGSPSDMGMPDALAVEVAGDVNAALGPDLAFVFDGELGDGSIDIHDNVENTFVDINIAEEVLERPPIEMEEGACRCVRSLGSFLEITCRRV